MKICPTLYFHKMPRITHCNWLLHKSPLPFSLLFFLPCHHNILFELLHPADINLLYLLVADKGYRDLQAPHDICSEE